MKPEHKAWIDAYVKRHNGFVRGLCHKATTEMVAAFPELRRAAGFAYWIAHRPIRDQHFWCVAPDGTVVDPTVAQFGDSPVHYEELDLDDPETRKRIPTGVCMDCGADVYGGDTFCREECENATRASMGFDPVRRA